MKIPNQSYGSRKDSLPEVSRRLFHFLLHNIANHSVMNFIRDSLQELTREHHAQLDPLEHPKQTSQDRGARLSLFLY
jgi:hypothetical protein